LAEVVAFLGGDGRDDVAVAEGDLGILGEGEGAVGDQFPRI